MKEDVCATTPTTNFVRDELFNIYRGGGGGGGEGWGYQKMTKSCLQEEKAGKNCFQIVCSKKNCLHGNLEDFENFQISACSKMPFCCN